jgi:hypothetical protein
MRETIKTLTAEPKTIDSHWRTSRLERGVYLLKSFALMVFNVQLYAEKA